MGNAYVLFEVYSSQNKEYNLKTETAGRGEIIVFFNNVLSFMNRLSYPYALKCWSRVS